MMKKYKLEILELKNTKSEIKNSLDGFNSRNKMEKQSISDFGEEKKKKMKYLKNRQEKALKKINRILDLYDIQKSNVQNLNLEIEKCTKIIFNSIWDKYEEKSRYLKVKLPKT